MVTPMIARKTVLKSARAGEKSTSEAVRAALALTAPKKPETAPKERIFLKLRISNPL